MRTQSHGKASPPIQPLRSASTTLLGGKPPSSTFILLQREKIPSCKPVLTCLSPPKRGLEIEGGRPTGALGASSMSHSYRSDRGSPTALVTPGGQVHSFCHPSQEGDYFGTSGQFRSASSASYQQLNHPQDGMYGSAPVQHFPTLSNSASAAPFERQHLYRCF